MRALLASPGIFLALAAATAHGCGPLSSAPDGSPSDDLTEVTAETGAPTVVESGAPAEVAFAGPPALRRNELAGLTAFLDVELTGEAELVIEVDAGGRRYTLHEPAARTHEVLLLGLRPDADVLVDVTAVGPGGVSVGPERVSVHTAPLPEDLVLPAVEVLHRDRMEPGFTAVTDDAGHITLVDADGEPVWFVAAHDRVNEVQFSADGWVRYNRGDRSAIEVIDLSGRRALRLAASTAPTRPGEVRTGLTAMHHDVVWLPNAHFLALDVQQTLEMYPTSENNPRADRTMQYVARDVVRELDPSGQIVGSWAVADLLDGMRIGRNSINGDYWFGFGDWEGDYTRDWGHGNALSYDPASDTVLLSLRHQDAVVAFRRGTGELLWILAPPMNWRSPWREKLLTPVDAGFRYPYHQHAAKFCDDGSIMMFDNGNHQLSAWEDPSGDEEEYSRVVQVMPDPKTMTVREVWSWGGSLEQRIFSPSMGDADPLPLTGNVLVTVGNPNVSLPVILEIARDGTIVWQAMKRDAGSWYRSARVTGLFPWE